MATGNGNNNNNPNGDISFSQNVEPKSGVAGWLQNKQTRNEFRDNVWKDNGYLSESIKELEEMNKLYAEMEKFSDRMTKTEQKRFAEQKRIVQQQLNSLNKYKEAQSMSDKEAIDNIKLANKLRLDGLTYYQKQLNILKETDKKHQKQYEEHLRDAAAVYDVILDRTREINGELDEASTLLKKTSDNFADSLSNTLKSYGDKLAGLSNMFNLQAIANNSMETNARSKAAIMTSVNRQFGFTSNSQFESFKNSLNDTIKDMNKEMGAIFNAEDLKGYMANLAQYNITNTDMAQQQMRSSIIASKYLGVSAETQTQIFKYMKLTNNNEILNNHNKTIVGLLKSDLGVSKEQLDMLSKIAMEDNDMKSIIGMTPEAINAQNDAMKIVGASLTPLIGDSKASAIMDSFNKFITNPGDQGWASVLGGNYSPLYNRATTANTKEAQTQVLKDFIQAVIESPLLSSYGSGGLDKAMAGNYLYELSGINSGAFAGLQNLNLSELNKNIEDSLQNISSITDSEVESYVEQTQQTTALEKVSNLLDTWVNGFNWKYTMNLANIAFGMYIASGAVKLFGSLSKFIGGFSGGEGLKGGLKALMGSSGTAMSSGITKLAGFLGNPVTLTAAITAAIFAGADAWNKHMSSDISNKATEDFKNSDNKYANNTSAQAIRGLTAGEGNKEGRTGWGKIIGDLGDTAGAVGLAFSKMGTGISNWGKADGYKTNKNFIKQNKSFFENMFASSVLATGAEADLYTIAFAYLLDEVGSLDSLEGVQQSFLKEYVKNGDFVANDIQGKINALISSGWAPSGYNMEKATGLNTIDRYLMNGLNWVPKDNFIAQLHKGEMVLNRREAEQYRELMGISPYGIGGESDTLYAKGIRGKVVTGLPWVMTAGYGKYPTLNKQHRGLDFGIAEGTPVGAAFSGVVDSVTTGWGGGYGNSVYIKGDNGVYYRYAHLSKLNVKAGQQVAAGDTIGLSGNTGNSTGPHLHFQTDRPYGSRNDINPYAYVTSSLFQATGNINIGEDGKTSSTGTASQIAHIPVQTRKFIPKAFAAASEGGIGGAQEIVGSVNGGFDKLINYLDSIREEQTAQRAIISAFAKSRTSESNF